MVVIINGRGGVGKDTLCNGAATVYETQSASSIDPIKKIAAEYGWQGEKDEKSRKFLADLKQAFCSYNDLPTRYLLEQCEGFLQGEKQILFLQIREGSEIDKFRRKVTIPCVTVLIRRGQQEDWGNPADDNVEAYHYDAYFENELPLPESQEEFNQLLRQLLDQLS
jgi:hypothetical protein